MTQRTKIVLLVTLILLQAASAGAITRAARKVGFLELHGGYAMPQGEYDGIPGHAFDFGGEIVNFDAKRVYDDGFSVGFSYGQILNKHWLVSVGLDYATNKVKNPIIQVIEPYQYQVDFIHDPTYKSYDFTVRSLYSLFNPVRHSWSPYFGLAAVAGMTAVTVPGAPSESEFAFGLNIDFGLDVKVWQLTDSRQFVTLSSINSWNFMSTNERVSHLQVGAGIKYFFGP